MEVLKLDIMSTSKKPDRGAESMEARISALEAAIGRLSLQLESSQIALVYPEPIATPLARERGAILHHERFFSLLDAIEAFIKYSGAIAIGLFRMAGRDYDIYEEFKQPPSIGKWVETLHNIVTSLSPDNAISEALKSSLMKANGKLSPAGRFFIEEFTNIRNEQRGHAAALSDNAYEQLHLRHSSVVHDAFDTCAHLRYPLLCVESADVATDPISYDVRQLVGPAPLTRIERIHSSSKLRLGSVYVWDKADCLVDLSDLLVYKTCPTCNLAHTFFLEKIVGKSRHYHSYFGNHRFNL